MNFSYQTFFFLDIARYWSILSFVQITLLIMFYAFYEPLIYCIFLYHFLLSCSIPRFALHCSFYIQTQSPLPGLTFTPYQPTGRPADDCVPDHRTNLITYQWARQLHGEAIANKYYQKNNTKSKGIWCNGNIYICKKLIPWLFLFKNTSVFVITCWTSLPPPQKKMLI